MSTQALARRILAELREQLPDDVLHPRIVSRALGAASARAPAFSAADPDALYAQRDGSRQRATGRRQIWAGRLAANPRDFEAAWKLARARYWLGGHAPLRPSASDARDGHRGRRARRSPSSRDRPEGHFWLAANMGALAESFGLRQGLKYRGDIKAALLTVLKLDPAFQQGSADRALGRWYYKVPGLFGGSNKKSEEHLRAVAHLQPEQHRVAVSSSPKR